MTEQETPQTEKSAVSFSCLEIQFFFLPHNSTSTAATASLHINRSLVTNFSSWQQTAAPMGWRMISGFSRWPQQIEVWILRPDFKSIKHYYFVPRAPSTTPTSEHRKGNKWSRWSQSSDFALCFSNFLCWECSWLNQRMFFENTMFKSQIMLLTSESHAYVQDR